MGGFSFASLILSYFLVGGGMFTGTLMVGTLEITSEVAVYLLLAGGAFLGGFVAGRASRGSTIVEPVLGAIGVVATVVALASSTAIGKLVWAAAQGETLKLVAQIGLTGVGGALIGAFLSEKLLGEASTSSVPWVLYTALSTFGACLLSVLFASILLISDADASSEKLGTMMLIGMAAGCLLSGLAVGASARSRPLLAALLGGGAGVAGFCLLLTRATRSGRTEDDTSAILILAAGGCVVALIGALIGWAAVGKRRAG